MQRALLGSLVAVVATSLVGTWVVLRGGDIRTQLVATVAVVVTTIVLYRPFLALTFNKTKAQTLGMHPALAQAAMLCMLALSIVASFQAIGTLLVFGLLVGPPATASLLVRRIPAVMAASAAIGAVAVVVGLAVSFHHGTAGGATIAGLCVGNFFVVLVVTELRGALTRPS